LLGPPASSLEASVPERAAAFPASNEPIGAHSEMTDSPDAVKAVQAFASPPSNSTPFAFSPASGQAKKAPFLSKASRGSGQSLASDIHPLAPPREEVSAQKATGMVSGKRGQLPDDKKTQSTAGSLAMSMIYGAQQGFVIMLLVALLSMGGSRIARTRRRDSGVSTDGPDPLAYLFQSKQLDELRVGDPKRESKETGSKLFMGNMRDLMRL